MKPEEEGTVEGLIAQEVFDSLRQMSKTSAISRASLDSLAKSLLSLGSLSREVFLETEEVDAEEGLEVILETIRNSEDKKKAASRWLTELTAGIAAMTKEMEE